MTESIRIDNCYGLAEEKAGSTVPSPKGESKFTYLKVDYLSRGAGDLASLAGEHLSIREVLERNLAGYKKEIFTSAREFRTNPGLDIHSKITSLAMLKTTIEFESKLLQSSSAEELDAIDSIVVIAAQGKQMHPEYEATFRAYYAGMEVGFSPISNHGEYSSVGANGVVDKSGCIVRHIYYSKPSVLDSGLGDLGASKRKEVIPLRKILENNIKGYLWDIKYLEKQIHKSGEITDDQVERLTRTKATFVLETAFLKTLNEEQLESTDIVTTGQRPLIDKDQADAYIVFFRNELLDQQKRLRDAVAE